MHAKPVDAVSMHDSALNRFLAAQTWLDMLMWGGIGLIMLASVFWLLRAEKHRFDQLGKGRGWIRVRLLALPMLLISAALVVLPARSIPGMEALAYFYFALFTLVPLTWFGLHWLAGAMQTPRFSCGESFTLAFTGLLVLLVPLLLAGMLQGPIFRASHLFSQRAQADVEPSRLALEVQPVQRFRLGSAGEIFSQTLRAPAASVSNGLIATLAGIGAIRRHRRMTFSVARIRICIWPGRWRRSQTPCGFIGATARESCTRRNIGSMLPR
jgi:hypothetical protein